MSTKGRCPTCDREITLTKAGLIRSHGAKLPGVWPPRNCEGQGKRPATVEGASDGE